MGQIIATKAHADRCNLQAIQEGGSKADIILVNGEIWLVDSTNADKGSAGYGKYDSYIKGNGSSAARNLTLHKIDDPVDDESVKNFVTVKYKTPSGQLVIDGEVGDLWIYGNTLKKCIMAGGTAAAQYETITPNPDKIYKYNTTFFCYYNNAFVQVGERGPQGLDGYEIFDSLDDLTGKTAEQKALMIPNATLIEAILALIPDE